MPVCSVAPSGTKTRTSSAMARSTSVGTGSSRTKGSFVGLDQDVDLVDVQGVGVLTQAERAGEGGLRFDDEEPVGVGPGPVELLDGGAGVQGQAAPTVGVGEGGRRGHDPGRLGLQDRDEAPEVRRGEAEVCPRVPQHPLEGPEEAAQVVDVRVGEDVAEHGQQPAVDAEVGPVGPGAQGLQEGDGLARPQRDAERVRRSELVRCVRGGQAAHVRRRRP